MINERINVVSINYSCGCTAEVKIVKQPGFSQIVRDLEAKQCPECSNLIDCCVEPESKGQ